jgi:hypothetical protein
MKLKLLFTAEISQDVGDIPEDKIFTEEQNKAMLDAALREMAGETAEIVIHECKLTKMN